MFRFHSIEQYHSELTTGTITCRQVVDHYLQQIQHSAHLNAFVQVYAAEALQQAETLDQQRLLGKSPGRLHGVVIGLKDVICYEGHAVSASSKILQGFTSLYSATVVQRLLEQEAIIIGNLNCDEFAMGSTNENSLYGKVLNAADTSRVPGGSSGGSAVAVQAGLCMLSLGSDTGGSVRQPADFCGIIGLKPSYGRLSRYGLIAYASSFDQIGIFGTHVRDVALLLEIMAGADEQDSTVADLPVDAYCSGLQASPDQYRIAYFPEALDSPGLDPEISQAIKEKLNQLSEQGHQVDPVAFDLLDYLVPTYYVLTTAEASSNLSRFDGVRYGYRSPNSSSLAELYKNTRSEGFGMEVKRRIMLGTFVLSAGYYDAYFTAAQKVRQLLKTKLSRVFENYDFIIMPTAPTTAFKIGEKTIDPIEMYLSDIYTVMANLTGSPAISLPLFRHTNGMPFGLQVMADGFKELPLLRISSQLLAGHGNHPATVN